MDMTIPMSGRPQQADVVVVGQHAEQQHPDGQGDEDVGGELALGRQRLHLTLEHLALAQRGGRGAQRLGQVATDLALDADRHRGPAHVLAVHARAHVVERVADVGADPRLGQRPRELLGRRLGGVLGDRVQGLQEAEAGGERGGHQHEDVREDGLELAGPAPGQVAQDDRRQDEADDEADDQPDDLVRAEQDEAADRRDDHREDAEHEPLARTPRQVGAVHELHRAGSSTRGPTSPCHPCGRAAAEIAVGFALCRAGAAGAAEAVRLDRRQPLLLLRPEGVAHERGGEEEQAHASGSRSTGTAPSATAPRRWWCPRRPAAPRPSGSRVGVTTGAVSPRSTAERASKGAPPAVPVTTTSWVPATPAGRLMSSTAWDSRARAAAVKARDTAARSPALATEPPPALANWSSTALLLSGLLKATTSARTLALGQGVQGGLLLRRGAGRAPLDLGDGVATVAEQHDAALALGAERLHGILDARVERGLTLGDEAARPRAAPSRGRSSAPRRRRRSRRTTPRRP